MNDLEVHIRFSDSTLADLVTPFNSSELYRLNSAFLRSLVRNHDPQLKQKTQKRRLRFIYNGIPLTDTVRFQSAIKTYVKHAKQDESAESGSSDSVSQKSNGNKVKEQQDVKGKGKLLSSEEEQDQQRLKIYIHCLVGGELSKEEMQEEDELDKRSQEQQNVQPEPIGFDRLLTAGFSRDEVDELRQQFQQLHGTTGDAETANDLDEEFDDESDYEEDGDGPETSNRTRRQVSGAGTGTGTSADLRELEESWIEGTVLDPQDNNNNNNGSYGFGLADQGDTTNRDLLVGVMFGAIFGILSLLLLRSDFKVFNKKTRMAVVAGMVLNFIVAFVRSWS